MISPLALGLFSEQLFPTFRFCSDETRAAQVEGASNMALALIRMMMMLMMMMLPNVMFMGDFAETHQHTRFGSSWLLLSCPRLSSLLVFLLRSAPCFLCPQLCGFESHELFRVLLFMFMLLLLLLLLSLLLLLLF